jgi:molybdate transport system substrate-binding protein
VIAPLRVFAAGSLRPAFDRLAAGAPGAISLTYANARDLAERIERGACADVYASASAEHPLMLQRLGLAETPRAFATNRVVVAVARDSSARDARIIAAPRTRLVVEIAGIPLGDYTRELLSRMDEIAGPWFSERALANIVAQEEVVDDVAARILAGDADAGVLYATDVVARIAQLRAIEVPVAAEVAATYVACVTSATSETARAEAWVEELLSPSTQAILREAGFAPVGLEAQPESQSA